MDCRVKPGNDGGGDNLPNSRADIPSHEVYINRARHVRAFGVRQGWKMTGTTRSSHGLDDRRKRQQYRCWHRGTREMDLILGRFADAHIALLDEQELAELERVIGASDPDLYAALSGSIEPTSEFAGAFFERIKAFRIVDSRA